jgi:nitrogen fixation-related uncharacterized protein
MEAMILLFVVVTILALLGAASLRWGVDSREPRLDDRIR